MNFLSWIFREPDYGKEKAELQRILTKRNATIGRLRAANRELRWEKSLMAKAVERWRESFVVGDEDEAIKRHDEVWQVAVKLTLGRDGLDEALRLFEEAVEKQNPSAEISPPPEPVFAGPLKVGGWYEDNAGRVCQCVSSHLRMNGIVQFCCVRTVGSDWYRANGRTISGDGPSIIRKVDPPGGES